MRTKEIIERRGAAVLDAPDETSAPQKRWTRTEPPRPRREMVEDFADDDDTAAFLRSAGKNRRIRKSLIPQSKWGRIGAGVGLAAVLGAIGAGLFLTARFFTHDERFRIASSQYIEITGNTHITRSQLLSIFGEDVERNVFHVPLAQRKLEVERMPWVEHATVMRLLPNHIRVQVVERTPIAFVRQGRDIGMVDASGVLLDIPPDAPGNPNYSFPVVTGISANDPVSTRAPRMKLYQKFLHDLDSGGEKVSSKISEVDLSDPEDIRALIPEGNIEVLAHFGQQDFLARYKRMQDHMAEWKSMYPHLSSVDMRYERQVVLQVPQGSATAAAQAAVAPVDAVTTPPSAKSEPAKKEAAKPASATVAKHEAPPAKHEAPRHTAVAATTHPANVPPKAAAKPSAAKTTEVPATHAASASAKPAAGAKTTPVTYAGSTGNAKADAEREKRIAAIHAWMAKREAQRKASATAHPGTSSTASTPAR